MRKQVLFIAAILTLTLSGCAQPEEQQEAPEVTTLPPAIDLTQEEETSPAYENLENDIETADLVRNKTDKTVQDCESIVDESLKERCINEVHLFNALNNYDISICNEITDETDKKGCIERVEQAELFRD